MQWYCKKCNYKLTVMELQQVSSDQANMKDEAPLIDPGLYLNASEIDIHFEKPIDFFVNEESIVLHNHKADCWLPHFIGISEETVSKHPLW